LGKTTTLRLTDADDRLLARLTRITGLKRSQVIRIALRRFEASLDRIDSEMVQNKKAS
jgi:predicted transcriptional regulator